MSSVVLSSNEKKLLMYSVNYYIEKIEFNIRHSDTMYLGSLGEAIFKYDLETLKSLRDKLFGIDVYSEEPDVLLLDNVMEIGEGKEKKKRNKA